MFHICFGIVKPMEGKSHVSSPWNRLRSNLKFNLTSQIEFRVGSICRIMPVKYSQGVKIFPKLASWVLKSPQTCWPRWDLLDPVTWILWSLFCFFHKKRIPHVAFLKSSNYQILYCANLSMRYQITERDKYSWLFFSRLCDVQRVQKAGFWR